jgi:flagellar biosynthesis/type III secretory pathway protein FliH
MVKTNSFNSVRLPHAPRRVLIKPFPSPATPADVENKNEPKPPPIADAPPPPEAPGRATEAPPPGIDVQAMSQSIRRDVEEEYTEKWRVAGALLDEAAKLKARSLQESESIIFRLAFEISKKIVRCEARINPEVCVENLREALRRLQSPLGGTVWMNPRDLERLEDRRDIKSELKSAAPQFTLKPRSDIAPGGCIVDSDAGTIDATIESQLAEIERLLDEITA